MISSSQYFIAARTEEVKENASAALLLYISSFCSSFNLFSGQYPYGTTKKKRRLQRSLVISDRDLLQLVRSYGPLTTSQCRALLYCSIYGNISGIESVLRNANIREGGAL